MFPEVRAGGLSGRFRHRAYRTVQTRPVSSRSVHHGIFPDVYFYTQSLQRPHEHQWRQGESKFLPCFSLLERRLAECFPWATELPNPPKETLTFQREFFWQTTSGSLPAGHNLHPRHLERALTPRVCVNHSDSHLVVTGKLSAKKALR